MSVYGGGSGYGRYRGRKPSGTRAVLLGIIVVLAAILLILGIALFFLQDNMVYGDDGVHMQLPWGKEEVSSTPAPQYSAPILITDGGEEDDRQMLLHAVEVSHTALLAGTAETQVENSGGNAAVVSMKGDDGMLSYVSAVPLAVSAGASGNDLAANKAVEGLLAGKLYTIAKVSCFRDHLLPGYDETLAIHTNSGYRWADFGEMRWSSPANESVRGYITDICVELAKMGFDEILLTNCGYPTGESGNMGWIKKGTAYPKDALDSVITPFLAQVHEALEPYGVKLSVQAEGAELVGESSYTGLNLENVLTHADRFWVSAAQAEDYANFAAAGGETDPSEKLVRFSQIPGSEESHWAILN